MLELRRTVYVLERWWWLIAAAAIVGAVVAYGLTKTLVQQQYESTAVVSLAPPPSSPLGTYTTMLAASADAQLVPTLVTAQAALHILLPSVAKQVDASTLSGRTTASASPDNQLLYVSDRWTVPGFAPLLANAVAGAFIAQERSRLETRYALIHAGLIAQERHLAALMQAPAGSGQARSWLQAQYADTTSKIYQTDADSRIQASIQEASLQLAQPATTAAKVGPKATINAAFGAALALILALVFAFVATGSYGQDLGSQELHPVLQKVGD
jgi:capsular polysaccharide biosynthesis protein